MLSPLVSWILPSSSSSSSSDGENVYSDDGDHYENVGENEHFLSEPEEFPSTSCAASDPIPIPVALAIPDASPSVTVAFPPPHHSSLPNVEPDSTVTRPKRQRINYSNRQYQRLWTKQDEIELLRGYLDYIRQRPWATSSLQNDVALFYDRIRPKLKMGFNQNQLVEKLRRLKRKHKNAWDKFNSGREVSYKSPQEEAIFHISQRIWGKNRDQESSPNPDTHSFGNIKMKSELVDSDEMRRPKRSRLISDVSGYLNDQNIDNTSSIQGLIEETMRSCLSPMVKEVLNNVVEGSVGVGGLSLSLIEQSGRGGVGDEKWRKQRIMELEEYLKRLELLQDQIKARLEELRSSGE